MAKWGNCDFKQLKELQKQLDQMVEKDAEVFIEKAAKELATRLLRKVIQRTPVAKTTSHNENLLDDGGNAITYKSGKNKGKAKQQKVIDHMGGTLRRGWTAKTEDEAKSGGNNKDEGQYANSLPITKNGDTYQIEIINPVSYGIYVEYGHRQQPGRYVPTLGKSLKKSWVPGKFMLTMSEQELQSQAPAILEKKIQKYLEECFNDN